MAFTLHVRFELEGGEEHTVEVSGKETVGEVVRKAAGEVKVDAEDITLYDEGVPLDDLTQHVDGTSLVEGSVVEARPSRRYEARRELTDIGLGWEGESIHDVLDEIRIPTEEKVRVVGLMLEAGADVGAVDMTKKNTPLHHAALNGKVGVAQVLVSGGADVEAANNRRRTPLHDASLGGHLKVVQLLVDAGADVGAVDKENNTPLHIAAYYGYLEVAKVLLSAGADIEAVNNEDCTPLDDASIRGHPDVVQLLVEG